MTTEAGFYAHPTAVIDQPCEIGSGTRVWHFSHVMAGARIGENCILGQNVYVDREVRIGSGCKIQNNVSVYKGVLLEDRVFCGPSVTFTNVLNPRAFIERKEEFRPTTVGEGATLGANSTIVCGLEIGRFSLVGAGAVVVGDVPPHALVVGVPARQAGWVCRCGATLPEGGEPACRSCGSRYRLDGDLLEPAA